MTGAPITPGKIPPGQWPERVQAFLSRHFGCPVQVANFRRFPGGMSWITIGFTAYIGDARAGTRELILRVGDPAGLLAPYSASPEYQVLSALAGVPGLPVPPVVTFTDDAGVLGAPFLINGRVDGSTPGPWDGPDCGRDPATNRALGEQFGEILGVLHHFDWRGSPLASWGHGLTGQNSAAHEIERWARHADITSRRSPPLVYYAMRWLQANAPEADHLAIVHGDYRVGNFLQANGRITAILDWELVHLGDPHEDLAYASARAFSKDGALMGGMIPHDDFRARYLARGGRAICTERLRYYDVLIQFKIAAMLLGALRRVETGTASDVRMASMGFQLAPTLMELNRMIREAR